MITYFAHFLPLANNPHRQPTSLLAKMPPRFRNDPIPLAPSLPQHLHLRIRQIRSRKPSSQIQQFHPMSTLFTNFHQFCWDFDRLFEGGAAVLSGATVEMQTVEVYVHWFYFQ